MQNNKDFNVKLATECAKSFSISTDIGCMVSLSNGDIVYEVGHNCSICNICKIVGIEESICTKTHTYGMIEAERFGGKYVYNCPMGLTCFVSPIIGTDGACAKITAGPILMVDKDDYIEVDLKYKLKLTKDIIELVTDEINKISNIPADKVTAYSSLLFMAVGFMNNVNESNRLLEKQESYEVQNQINSFIMKLKQEDQKSYPFDVENKLLECISKSDREGVKKYLNEILGFIFLYTGNNLLVAKSRVYELLILISRKSINSGADPEKMLWQCHEYLQYIPNIKSFDELGIWLTKITSNFMDSLFTYMDVRHDNIIHNAMHFIYSNYNKKISLETVANEIYLSTQYFSRVFKKETGTSFIDFLNNIRIEKSKELLKLTDMKIVDVALSVGFDDQSYFTKVFKKKTGLSPAKYRNKYIK